MSEITPQAKLRSACSAYYCLPIDVFKVCREAADRIDELEAALQAQVDNGNAVDEQFAGLNLLLDAHGDYGDDGYADALRRVMDQLNHRRILILERAEKAEMMLSEIAFGRDGSTWLDNEAPHHLVERTRQTAAKSFRKYALIKKEKR